WALISPYFNCFGPSSNSSSQVYENAENSSQSKPSSSGESKLKEKSKGVPIVVSYFLVNYYPLTLVVRRY
ncbi:transmembrane protein, putative, partial [Medicago truncatula]